MPPKAPAKPAAKKGGPPAAMLAKIKAQMEAQKAAEEAQRREEEEAKRRWEEEQRLAEEERKREELEKKEMKEEKKDVQRLAKEDEKRRRQEEALERMRKAGMIVPDLPAPDSKADKPKAEPKPKPAAKPAPKPAPKHADPTPVAAHVPEPEPEPELEIPNEDEDDWETIAAKEEAIANAAKAAEQKLVEERARAAEAKKIAAAAPPPPKGHNMIPATYAADTMGGGPEPLSNLRSPICCVLGHVDTGKTSLLDKMRHTNVQGGEAGGITQQIGASFFPRDMLVEATKAMRSLKQDVEMRVPGLLVIDTPGHESFTNLRSRGSSLCDIAVLVVDLMHGLEPQTKESIRLLREKKCPFIVALNKIDRLYEWKPQKDCDVQTSLSRQPKHVLSEFETRVANIVGEFQAEGLNAELYYKNQDIKKYVSLVPTSAHTGEGICDLLCLMIQLVQRFMEGKVAYKDELQCTVLEVKVEQGFGPTIDCILVNGQLHEGQRILVAGINGPIDTQIRALLTPQPLREMRVKGEYVHHHSVRAAMGVKISAHHLEDAVPGTQLLALREGDDVNVLQGELMKDMNSILSQVDRSGIGVHVQSSTLGALEALLSFLGESKIPVSNIAIGPIHKRHMLSVLAMKERNPKYSVVLAFDVVVTKEAQEIADKNSIKIFSAKIIYHLFDMFTLYVKNFEQAVAEKNKDVAVFPVILDKLTKIRAKDPIIVGCVVAAGNLHLNTPLCVVREGIKTVIGRVTGIERDNKEVKVGKTGMELAVKIVCSDANLTFGRQIEEKDTLQSSITRESIDALKESFRAQMEMDDWRLIVDLKKDQRIP